MMANNVTQVDGRGVFKGSDEQLCNSIDALLDLNAKGAVSHRVPGMAVTLLEAAADRLAATRPAPKADSALVGELRGLLESASLGPWAYRPEEFDDWGVIRGPERTVEWADYPVRPFVAQARHSDMQGEEYLAECRKAKTDPWAGDAKLIVWMRNHADTILAALSDRDVVLEELLPGIRATLLPLTKQGEDRIWRPAEEVINRIDAALKGGVDE